MTPSKVFHVLFVTGTLRAALELEYRSLKKEKLVQLDSEKLKIINALLINSKIISVHKQAVTHALTGCFIQQ